jgi:hypothetical protein
MFKRLRAWLFPCRECKAKGGVWVEHDDGRPDSWVVCPACVDPFGRFDWKSGADRQWMRELMRESDANRTATRAPA